MGIVGTNVKIFKEANLAHCVDIDLDSDYPHVFFDVLGFTDNENKVILRSHWDNTEFKLKIHKNENYEYAEIEQKSSFEEMMDLKPAKFKIYPFKGERFRG